MMKFTPIASSSRGNAYLVEAPGVQPLLLEAGLSIKTLREKLNFGLSSLSGCIVSHEHGDHSKAVKDLLKQGVDCFMSAGTASEIGVADHHRLSTVSDGVRRMVSSYTVMPFPLVHDAAEPLGFLISYGDDRLLFIPDTGYVENRFNGVTILAVECNHVSDILSQNVLSGSVPNALGRRVRRTHMELSVLIDMLRANDLSRCRQIYLLHLSDANSDEQRMRREVQEATGIPTEVCA